MNRIKICEKTKFVKNIHPILQKQLETFRSSNSRYIRSFKPVCSELFRFRLSKSEGVHEIMMRASYFSSSGHSITVFSPFKSFNSILFCTPYRQPWQIATSMTVISLKDLERRRKKNQIDTQTTIYVAVSIKMINFATNNWEFQCM